MHYQAVDGALPGTPRTRHFQCVFFKRKWRRHRLLGKNGAQILVHKNLASWAGLHKQLANVVVGTGLKHSLGLI